MKREAISTMKKPTSLLRSASGQGLLEFGLVLPLILVLVLGVVEVSYALLDQHVVTKLTREGSNMISRDTSLDDALKVMKSMSTRPVSFPGSSKVIFSVIKDVATTTAANFGLPVLYQRLEYGSLPNSSYLMTSGAGSFGSGPDYQAANSDTDTRLRVTNLPPNLISTGGMLYITEIYTSHPLITPFDRFGISIPTTLYSIAYF
jgi:TadE-like protein